MCGFLNTVNKTNNYRGVSYGQNTLGNTTGELYVHAPARDDPDENVPSHKLDHTHMHERSHHTLNYSLRSHRAAFS